MENVSIYKVVLELIQANVKRAKAVRSGITGSGAVELIPADVCLEFGNIDLYDKIGFKKKINNITTESRKFYKKPILSLSKKKVILTKEQIILIIVSRNS